MIRLAFFIVLFLYVLALVYLTYKWIKLEKAQKILSSGIGFSIIIIGRNEAMNIEPLLNSVSKLAYKNFEVIYVDDDSTDDSLTVLEKIRAKNHFQLQILALKNKTQAGKKEAINKAMVLAKNEIILSSDADCILPKYLLNYYLYYFENKNAELVAGPVSINAKNSFLSNFQFIEFCALQAVAAVSISTGKPNMCSAANLAYKKSTFVELDPYHDNMIIPSGDDEFLLHKFSEKFPDKIFYLKEDEALVNTLPCDTFLALYNQRKRWASKWAYYKDWKPKALAIFIFLVNFITIVSYFLGFYELIFLRFITELISLAVIISFFGDFKKFIYIPIIQVFYSFYVVFIGFSNVLGFKSYKWK